MANMRHTILRGISEVGAIRAAADVPFGRTAPDGVTIAFSGSELEVESGQSTFLEDILPTSDRIAVTVRLLYADLLNLKEILGLPDAALTGDLQDVAPTAEVIAILEANLRTREDELYVEAPGPAGARRYEFHRTKLRAGLTIAQSRDSHIILEGTWEVLRPATGNVVTITDAV